MRLPGNCVVATLIAWLLGARPRKMRNRSGRWHLYWLWGARAWEFYTPGASHRGYLRNALTLGTIRRVPALDEVKK